jgi:xylitol oxidase
MDRLQFLKISSVIAGGSILTMNTGCTENSPAVSPPHNWAGNIEFSTSKVFQPKGVEDLTAFIKKSGKIKAQGTRHCFNRIADSKNQLISMSNFNKILFLDKEKSTVKVEAGIKYGDLASYLHKEGYALHNLASLPHISVAGSIATATHGSGVGNGNLATQVEAIEFINAKGQLISLSKIDGDEFFAAVVGLGALGVATSITLRIQPTFDVAQHVFEFLPVEELKNHFEEIMSAGYSVSLFTDWQQDAVNEVWVKSVVSEGKVKEMPAVFFGGKAATVNMHPIASISSENCTEQMGVPGPWHERLPHFKMGFTPSSGKELQSEYFVPFENGFEAYQAIAALGKDIGPHLFISEIRSIAADDLWMSMAHKRKSISLHFTWKQEQQAVEALMPKIEKALEPFSPRPHWGKLFTVPSSVLAKAYPQSGAFKEFAQKHDPEGKFRNEFLDQVIWGS